ncbi:hypothetical protein HPB47_008392 [Ixodes persulcatus]|uniref:Uncharacterized protein n=1 Tax=Ixodes persulcatus TaxID=34615 RepID=A0AC60P4U8_IXOPE|nr:hypothetical protein HPB47_008392 [Ixodes persulcatus]
MTTRGPPEGPLDDDARGTDLACLKEETHRLQEADTWQLVTGTTKWQLVGTEKGGHGEERGRRRSVSGASTLQPRRGASTVRGPAPSPLGERGTGVPEETAAGEEAGEEAKRAAAGIHGRDPGRIWAGRPECVPGVARAWYGPDGPDASRVWPGLSQCSMATLRRNAERETTHDQNADFSVKKITKK